MNDLNAVCQSIGLAPPADDAPWAVQWEQTAASFDPDRFQSLTPEFVDAACRSFGMGDATRSLLMEGLAAFDALPGLRRLHYHLCHRLYHSDLTFIERRALAVSCPAPPPEAHPLASLFQAYVVLEGMPNALAAARHKGWDETILRHTWYDLELGILRHPQRAGHVGCDRLGWLVNHLCGRIVRLGRLQYCPDHVSSHVRGFRHRATRRLVIVSEGGYRYRRDGQFDGANGIIDPAAWTSVYQRSGGIVRAHPISPMGRALPEMIELPEGEWDEIIPPNAPAMGIHIPADGPMDFEACGESLRMAATVFAQYLPECPTRIFSCRSWLCDPQFSELLPPSSNIRRFQSQFYLIPLPDASERSLFIHLFGREFDDLDEIPQDNSLFRTIVQHKRNGGHWRRAGALLHADDLDWGGSGCLGTAGCESTASPQYGIAS